jgi:hypothetical protein
MRAPASSDSQALARAEGYGPLRLARALSAGRPPLVSRRKKKKKEGR